MSYDGVRLKGTRTFSDLPCKRTPVRFLLLFEFNTSILLGEYTEQSGHLHSPPSRICANDQGFHVHIRKARCPDLRLEFCKRAAKQMADGCTWRAFKLFTADTSGDPKQQDVSSPRATPMQPGMQSRFHLGRNSQPLGSTKAANSTGNKNPYQQPVWGINTSSPRDCTRIVTSHSLQTAQTWTSTRSASNVPASDISFRSLIPIVRRLTSNACSSCAGDEFLQPLEQCICSTGLRISKCPQPRRGCPHVKFQQCVSVSPCRCEEPIDDECHQREA